MTKFNLKKDATVYLFETIMLTEYDVQAHYKLHSGYVDIVRSFVLPDKVID